MRWRQARTVAAKELRETLRDRRTIVPMVVLPLVLYPALFLLVLQVASSQQVSLEAKSSRVASTVALPPDVVDAFETLEAEFEVMATGEYDALRARIDAGELDAAISPTPDWQAALGDSKTAEVYVLFDLSRERSKLAADRVMDALRAFADARQRDRLDGRGLPESFANPVELVRENIAPASKVGAWALGQILPLFLIMIVALGAYYPAVDLTAGEKERGTLLTLLTAPVSPLEVVVGKFGAVLAIATLTSIANVVAIALFFGQAASMVPEGAEFLQVELPGVVWASVLLFAAATGAFFSAMMLTVALFARTFKEAQSYLTPVYLLCVVPAVVAQLPGVEPSATTALVPGLGPALVLKALLIQRVSADLAFTTLMATLVYTGAILAMAAGLFQRESIIFSEDKPWRQLLPRFGRNAANEPKPTGPLQPGTALVLYAVVFVALYYGTALLDFGPEGLLLTVAVSIWLFVAGPTLLVAASARRSLTDVLGPIHPKTTPLRYWFAALALGLGAWLFAGALVEAVQGEMLPVPPEMAEAFAPLLGRRETAWEAALVFLALAVTPGIAEELLFRGAIQRALGTSLAGPWAIVATAALFALLHLSIYRLLGTFILGAIAGLIAYRARALGPAMLFHATNNAAALAWAQSQPEATAAAASLSLADQPAPFVALAAASVVVGTSLLFRHRPLR